MEAVDVFIMPRQFKNQPEIREMVELDGATILESCQDGHHEVRGTGYTPQHEILHVASRSLNGL